MMNYVILFHIIFLKYISLRKALKKHSISANLEKQCVRATLYVLLQEVSTLLPIHKRGSADISCTAFVRVNHLHNTQRT